MNPQIQFHSQDHACSNDARFEAMLLKLHSVIDFAGLWSAIQVVTGSIAPSDACALYLNSQAQSVPTLVATRNDETLRQWMGSGCAGVTEPNFNPSHRQPKICQLSDVAFDPRQLCHSEFLLRHMITNGWRHVARLLFWQGSQLSAEIALMRTAQQGALSNQEIAALTRLYAHIQATIQRLMTLEQRHQTHTSKIGALTPTERHLVHLVRAGLSNKEIAIRQQRSVRTVKTQLTSIYRKCGVRSRTRLLAKISDSVQPIHA